MKNSDDFACHRSALQSLAGNTTHLYNMIMCALIGWLTPPSGTCLYYCQSNNIAHIFSKLPPKDSLVENEECHLWLINPTNPTSNKHCNSGSKQLWWLGLLRNFIFSTFFQDENQRQCPSIYRHPIKVKGKWVKIKILIFTLMCMFPYWKLFMESKLTIMSKIKG